MNSMEIDGEGEDILELKREGNLHEERVNKMSSLPFPLELFALLANTVLSPPNSSLSTCSALNRTCRDIHYATLPALFSMVKWRILVPADQMVVEEAWQGLINSSGFEYTRILILATGCTNAYGLKTVSQYLSLRPELCNLRALIIKDADSLFDPYGARRPFQFETVQFGNLYNPGTRDVLDVWAGINDGGRGGSVAINLFLPLRITTRYLDDTGGRQVPFVPPPNEPVVHFDSVTLHLFHEDPGVEAYESWARGAVADTLGLLAYSWGLWGELSEAARQSEDLPPVDIIGANIEMAKHSVESFASALSVNSTFAAVLFHVSLEVPELSLSDIQRILAPLMKVYQFASEQMQHKKVSLPLGRVKISLVTGEDQAVVYMRGEPGKGQTCRVVLAMTDKRHSQELDLENFLASRQFEAEPEVDGDLRLDPITTDVRLLAF